MLINQRVKSLRLSLELSRPAFSDLCNIKIKTLENVENERQQINGEYIEKVIKAFPKYAYWLTTGETIPEAGQISPELEEIKENIKQTG